MYGLYYIAQNSANWGFRGGFEKWQKIGQALVDVCQAQQILELVGFT